MYAILSDRGRQHKVEKGGLLIVDKLKGEVGAKVVFDEVLVLGGEGGSVKIGSPTVGGAKVTGELVEHTKGEKLIAHHRVLTNSLGRRRGHRTQYTVVKITSIG
jgi:large subunit ribosomal protein L21